MTSNEGFYYFTRRLEEISSRMAKIERTADSIDGRLYWILWNTLLISIMSVLIFVCTFISLFK